MKNNSLKTLYYYLKEERKLLFLFLTVRIFMTTIDIYSPLLVKNLIDKAVSNKNMELLIKFSIALIILYILRFISAVNSQANGKLLGTRIRQSMRNRLVKKILNQPVNFFKTHKRGDIISRVMGDLDSVSTLCHRGLEDFIFSVVTITVSIVIMFMFNLNLSLIALIPLPFTLIFVYRENRKMKEGHRKVRKNNGILSATLLDILRTIFFLKDNTLEEVAVQKFFVKNDELVESEKKNIVPSSLIASGVTFYSNITQLVIILVGGYLYIKGSVTMGIILSFILLVDRFRLRIMRMVGLVDIYQKGMSGIRRFNEFIALDDRKDGDLELDERIETIKFENVGFRYGDRVVLKGMNLEIKKGDRVAFVGESGIGKTTTASLLKRASIATNGKIYINGKNIERIKFKSYLDRVGIVDQNDYILSDSIIDNITIVKDNYSESDLKRALDKAYIYDMIDRFENGERTEIGESGVEISTGQKQKIAMARIFLKNPDVLILDEATNAMDIINEKAILTNLKEEFSEGIIIAITHRLSILEDFNKVYLLGDEGIIEEGSFKELMERKERFYKLYHGIRG